MQTLPQLARPLVRKLIALPGRFMPYAAQKPVLSLVLNEAFRQPLSHGEMRFLEGARIRIKVTDLRVDWLVRIDADRFTPVDRKRKEDVCISGESRDFLLLATRRADPDTLFFQRRIRVEGDTELGLGVKNSMDSMDWDDLPLPLRRLLQGLGAMQEQLERAGVLKESSFQG